MRELLQTKPVQPFRICFFAEYFARCSILHITRLDDFPQNVTG
jgi:hypothetical protein